MARTTLLLTVRAANRFGGSSHGFDADSAFVGGEPESNAPYLPSVRATCLWQWGGDVLRYSALA